MENPVKPDMNRTGIRTAPLGGRRQIEFALQQPAHPTEPGGEADRIRAEYIDAAPGVGSVPVPATLAGATGASTDTVLGKSPASLMDKLGQRLAFERSGVRLYEAVIGKVLALRPPDAEELLDDLKHIRAEEFQHFEMLSETIRSLGGDPTAQTPCADVSGVAALGILQVVSDPRTTVAQSLEALLTVELTDNASWELLVELVRHAGHERLEQPFSQALAAEQDHAQRIIGHVRRCALEDADSA